MRSQAWILALVGAAVAAGVLSRTGAAKHPPDAHVVVVSIDGLMPEDVRAASAAPEPLPEIAALRTAGAVAEGVAGVSPSLTYPTLASLATGVRPGRHGIFQNAVFDPPAGNSRWHFEAGHLRVPALWDRARAAGLVTAAVSWPVTLGAKMDALIPAIEPTLGEEPWLERARQSATPGLVDEVVASLGEFGPGDAEDPIKRDRFSARAAALILKTYRPHLLLVRFVEADWVRHARGPHGEGVDEALQRLDERVGEVVAGARAAGIFERTTFVIAGDHGLREVSTALQPNVVLRGAGLLETGPDDQIRSWKAASQKGAIHLADPQDGATADRVSALFRTLAASTHHGRFRVVERPELDALGADPEALLYLEPAEGYVVNDRFVGDDFLAPAPVKAHNGFLEGGRDLPAGLVLSGAGVRPGARLPLVRQIDLAPTVALLLGFDMPGAEGTALEGALVADRRD